MTDIVDSKRRSELMANIRGRDTAPELAVRRIAHRMGLRFRLHRNDLPGRPDLVFPKHRLAVFVHGCFWHRHEGCRHASTPKSRVAFWTEKFAANVVRDARQEAALRALGWRVLVIWQCESWTRRQSSAGSLHRSTSEGWPTDRRAPRRWRPGKLGLRHRNTNHLCVSFRCRTGPTQAYAPQAP